MRGMGVSGGRIINNKLSLSGIMKYTNDNSDTSNFNLPDYTLINAKANYKISDSTNVTLKVENLLDQEYQIVKNYGTSDRAFYIQQFYIC